MKTYVLFINEDSQNPRLFIGDISTLVRCWFIFEVLPCPIPILLPLSVNEAEGTRYLKRIKQDPFLAAKKEK